MLIRLPLSWKLAVAFWFGALVLCLIAFVLQQLGWYDLSMRFFAYMALCVVGFFISWLCLVFIKIGEMAAQRKAPSKDARR